MKFKIDKLVGMLKIILTRETFFAYLNGILIGILEESRASAIPIGIPDRRIPLPPFTSNFLFRIFVGNTDSIIIQLEISVLIADDVR